MAAEAFEGGNQGYNPGGGRGPGPERRERGPEEQAEIQQRAEETEVRRATAERLAALAKDIEPTDKSQINNFVENLIERWKKEYKWEGSTSEIFEKIRTANPDVKFVKVTEKTIKKLMEEKFFV